MFLNGRAKFILCEQARLGNREAFGELVRRHRGKALGWATTLSEIFHWLKTSSRMP